MMQPTLLRPPGLIISKVDDTNTGIFFPAADTIAFAEGGVERARIDSSGRLLVGTSTALSTDSIFQVKSSNPANVIEISRRANDSSPARFNFSKTRGDATDIVLNNDTIGEILFRASDGVVATPIAAGISTHVDGTPGPNDMPGRLVFSTTSDGANSPTERMRITSDAYVRLAAGTGGIQFNGDTAAANALDDYEEGSWTATLSGLTNTSAEFSYFKYTKIGNRVHLQGRFLGQGAAASTGAVTITGVPFTAATLVVATAKAQSPWSAQAGWTDHVQLNSTTLTFKDSNGANSSITSGAISFSFSFTYQV
jgi:hypothetical protein